MANPNLSDDRWELVESLLPPDKPARSNGRPPISNRQILAGISFVLRTDILWECLPCEVGRGSGMTQWRCLHA